MPSSASKAPIRGSARCDSRTFTSVANARRLRPAFVPADPAPSRYRSRSTTLPAPRWGESEGRVLRLRGHAGRNELAGVTAGRAVAGDERHRRVEVAREVHVERGLSHRPAVEAALVDRAAGVGVVEHGARMPGASV